MFEKAYKIELKPTQAQINLLLKHFGCSRFVYNQMLADRIKLYETEKKSSTAYTDINKLPEMKREYEWLKEVDSTSLQISCQHLDQSYKNFFREKKGFPKFHKKGQNDSYTTRNPRIKSKRRLHLPKIGEIVTKENLPINKQYTKATISRKGNRFFVSILCKVDIQPKPKTEQEVGIDLGIADLAILSTGEKFENQKFLEKASKKLAREQRRMSKMQKGSNNRNKQRLRVARLHMRITNMRKDYLQKVSTDIVNRFDKIVVENLQVQNMQKNRYLARSIASASWSEFCRMLKYKCRWYGKEFIEVAPQNTSKNCSECGYKNDKLRLADRSWVCPECGVLHDRDINASINILEKSRTGSAVEPVDTLRNGVIEQENLS